MPLKPPVPKKSLTEVATKYFKPKSGARPDILQQMKSWMQFNEKANRKILSSAKQTLSQSTDALKKMASVEEEELIKRWQQNPNDVYMTQEVLKSISPIVKTIVGKWGGILPQSALYAKAQTLALEALKSWDPSQGKVSTYLYSRLQKISRDVYSMQNAVKIPEHHITQMGTFERAYHDVYARVNRPPTIEELADELTWSTDMVKRFLKYSQKEITTSDMADEVFGESYIDFRPETLNALGLVQGMMNEKEKCVYDQVVNSPITPSGSQVARKCKISQSDVSRIKKKIAQQIIKYRGY